MRRIVLALSLIWVITPAALAAEGVAVVMYHRFGEERYPSTNIRLEQFDQHIESLLTGGYTVLPLSEAVAKIRAREPLPDRAVAITVDDAHGSVFEHAAPRLKDAGLPWTLFVSTDAIDRNLGGMMSWDQVRRLAEDGVTIGAHSHAHGHMADMTADEVQEDFTAMRVSFEREMGGLPDLFAYPYGEAGPEVMAAVETLGFDAAFGQHSGVMSRAGPQFYFPRFPINERFGTEDRFALVSTAKAVLARVDRNAIGVFDRGPLKFTLTSVDSASLPNLTCFSGSGAVLRTSLSDGQLDLFVAPASGPGRQRFNCTAPAGEGRFFWVGHQYLSR